MADIEKDKRTLQRYFACLSMMMVDLFELSDNFIIRGYTVRRVLDKYQTTVFADKKRCKVGLLLPPELNSDAIVNEWHKQVLKNYKRVEKVKNHIKAVKGSKPC